ncbi:hypothetical protein CH372_19190 [Leptospira meyeri]|uniref:hypothetical protein n=1 Tax=Leptospira meyeri TaxID=29508 RepID=UPI000C2A26A8|nr:hypothetical protein [Leptospira meyeri]PKA10480.1 hypothetical protein CH372_19190 [Leptospira meyeri]PKA23037.1 hypothetical protein CH381_27915 [Leptospira sp. mixed culture ATI2-C-A1]
MKNFSKFLYALLLLTFNCYSFDNRYNQSQWFFKESSYLHAIKEDKEQIDLIWNYLLKDETDLSIDIEDQSEYSVKFLGFWKNSFYSNVRVFNKYYLIHTIGKKKYKKNDTPILLKSSLRNNIEKGQILSNILWLYNEYYKLPNQCGKNCEIYYLRQDDFIYEAKFIKGKIDDLKLNGNKTAEYRHETKMTNLNNCLRSVASDGKSTGSIIGETLYAAGHGGSGNRGSYYDSWSEVERKAKNDKITNCYLLHYPEMLNLQDLGNHPHKQSNSYNSQDSSENTFQNFQPTYQNPKQFNQNQNTEFKCYSDYDCQMGQKCAKSSSQSQGICANVVNNNGIPIYNYSPSPDSVKPGVGNCSFDTDCSIGFRCHKSTGSLYGNCLK